ncbi:unnamed protein product [Nyctereutes procyonoides]|uniref:(raccoon dog) hypothetical protein n=1 Tax=Nyctereutes procyonoides TaxID=34880 RepID=A0A811ZN50_NYCPR|nr:unnamed protein product [Nyctereutes procyonoides]
MGGEGRAGPPGRAPPGGPPVSREPQGFLKRRRGKGGSAAKERLPRERLASLPGSLFPRTTHGAAGAKSLGPRRDQTGKPPAREPLGFPGEAGDGVLRSRPPGRLQVPPAAPSPAGSPGPRCRCDSWGGGRRGVRTSALGPPTPRVPHPTPRSSALAGSLAASRTPALERGREEKGTEEVLPAEGTLPSAGFKSEASLKQIP